MIHPLVFGEGHRHFEHGGTPTGLRLIAAESTLTGVVVAAYRPREGA
jgi:hypothetical protein